MAAALAVVGFFVFGPIIEAISKALGNGVDWLIDHSLLPLASMIIEPAKVLFLNNAINHGVLTPLGIKQSAAEGKSILFLLEANPGPGAGSADRLLHLRHRDGQEHRPGGGDHPVLRRHPRDLLPLRADEAADPVATISGGMVGILTLTIFEAGLRAPAAPGSIIAVLTPDAGRQSGRGDLVGAVGRDDVVRDRLDDPAGQPQARRGGRPGRGDRPDGGA